MAFILWSSPVKNLNLNQEFSNCDVKCNLTPSNKYNLKLNKIFSIYFFSCTTFKFGKYVYISQHYTIDH